MSKQDRQGVRNFEQLMRRFNLDGIDENVVTEMFKQISQVNEHLTSLSTTVTQKLNILLSSNQTWFYGGVPTMESYPAAEWTDTTQKDSHIGDFYYDTDNEKVYIFTRCDGIYEWKSCFSGGCDVDHDAIRQEGYDEGYNNGYTQGQANRMMTGTFTLDANSPYPIITHNCGFVPSVFMVYPVDEYTLGNRMAIGCIMVNVNQFNDLNADGKPSFVWECQDASTVWYGVSSSIGELTETTIKLPYRSGTYIWKASFQYGWIAFE